MSSTKKKRILAAVLCAGTIAAFYQPAPVAAAGSGLTYYDDILGTRNVTIADSVTINGVTMYGSGALSASTISTSYIGATSGNIGGIGLNGNALTGVGSIDGASVAADGYSGLTIEGVTMNGNNLSVANNATVSGNTTVGGTLNVTGTSTLGNLVVATDAYDENDTVIYNRNQGQSVELEAVTFNDGDINADTVRANIFTDGTISIQNGDITGINDIDVTGDITTRSGNVIVGSGSDMTTIDGGNIKATSATVDTLSITNGITISGDSITGHSPMYVNTVEFGDTGNITTGGTITATGDITTSGKITATTASLGDLAISTNSINNASTGVPVAVEGVNFSDGVMTTTSGTGAATTIAAGTASFTNSGQTTTISGNTVTTGTLRANSVVTDSITINSLDPTAEISLNADGSLSAAGGNFAVDINGGVSAAGGEFTVNGSSGAVTIGSDTDNQTIIAGGTSESVAQNGSAFYQATTNAEGQLLIARDLVSGSVGVSTLSAEQIQNIVGYDEDYNSTRTTTVDEINDRVVDGDYSTTNSLTSSGSTLTVTDGYDTTTVATTAGGMSVTGYDGYGMDIDTTTGAVTFNGDVHDSGVINGATTTTINGNTITTGHITTDSITINGVDGTQTTLSGDGSVSLANGYFTVSKEGYLTNEFAGAHSTVSLTTDADGVHASYSNASGSTSRDLAWGVITDSVVDGSNSTTNTTEASGNTSTITDGTASNTTVATIGGTTTTVTDGTDTVGVTTTTSGTEFTSSTANTAFVTGGATSTTINGNTITTGQITTDKLIINNNAADGGNVGSGSELVLSGDGSITSSIESGSNQGDFSTSATAINSSVTNGTSAGSIAVTATAVTNEVTDGTDTTTVTTSAGSHVIAADGSTTTFDSNGILASNNGTQTTINGDVVTVGTGSDSTTISGSTVTVGASGSATTITDSDVELRDGTKLSELGHVEDIAPAINPGAGGTVVDGLNNLNTRVDDVNDRLDHVGAMSAAIASLKTMGYDPQAPTEVAVGAGTYKGSTGLALGVFHYPNRDFMMNISYTTSGGENMGGIGATWKFGRKTPEKLLEEQRKVEADKVKIAQEKAAAAAQLAQEAKERAEYAAKAAEKAKAEADIAADAAQKTYEKHVK